MNWTTNVFPLLRGGVAAPIKHCNATLDSARPGRSNASRYKASDLPRRALIKVARQFVYGRSDPSSKEGKFQTRIHSDTYFLSRSATFSRSASTLGWAM